MVYYIPHMAVLKPEAKSTKIRPVFDAKRGRPSLNDCIEMGPNSVQPMLDILIRFRTYPIALTADFKQAFLCVGLQEQVGTLHGSYDQRIPRNPAVVSVT